MASLGKCCRMCVCLAIPGVLGASGAACHDRVNLAAAPIAGTVSLVVDIQPIFDERCTTCHSPGSPANAVLGIRMLVTPRQLIDSPHDENGPQPPDRTPVTPEESQEISLWLKAGWNSPPVKPATHRGERG